MLNLRRCVQLESRTLVSLEGEGGREHNWYGSPGVLSRRSAYYRILNDGFWILKNLEGFHWLCWNGDTKRKKGKKKYSPKDTRGTLGNQCCWENRHWVEAQDGVRRTLVRRTYGPPSNSRVFLANLMHFER